MTQTQLPPIYQYSIRALNSELVIDLSTFRGKKMLLVNVASHCGFTPQYKGLQTLADDFTDQLAIIGFPCNQFLFQERGSESKIAAFCSTKYDVTFNMTTKIQVKGSKQHPIYAWLTKRELNGVGDFKVTWNFHKFLVDEEGKLLAHFPSTVKPLDNQILNYMSNNP